jgi:hypothetical protein
LVSAIAVAKETGFLPKHLGWDAKVIVETRFLGEGRDAWMGYSTMIQSQGLMTYPQIELSNLLSVWRLNFYAADNFL